MKCKIPKDIKIEEIITDLNIANKSNKLVNLGILLYSPVRAKTINWTNEKGANQLSNKSLIKIPLKLIGILRSNLNKKAQNKLKTDIIKSIKIKFLFLICLPLRF